MIGDIRQHREAAPFEAFTIAPSSGKRYAVASADHPGLNILSADGGVMDGMHRVCRALMDEQKTIRAVRFANDPEPDYFGVDAEDLPYEA